MLEFIFVIDFLQKVFINKTRYIQRKYVSLCKICNILKILLTYAKRADELTFASKSI